MPRKRQRARILALACLFCTIVLGAGGLASCRCQYGYVHPAYSVFATSGSVVYLRMPEDPLRAVRPATFGTGTWFTNRIAFRGQNVFARRGAWLPGWDINTTCCGTSAYSFPLWTPACLAMAGAVFFWRRSRPRTLPECSSCGYNLTGNTSGVCPECGVPTRAA
jgi:hypothetical protein